MPRIDIATLTGRLLFIAAVVIVMLVVCSWAWGF